MVTVKVLDVESSDIFYGHLTIKSPDVSVRDVQSMIDKIKDTFRTDGIADWDIMDIFEQFPDEWDWSLDDPEYESVVI